MGEFLSLTTTIQNLMLQEETYINEQTDNSADINLEHKHASNEITAIHDKYAPEKEQIKNEIEALDGQMMTAEYQTLVMELKELDEKEEDEVAQIEKELEEKQNDVDIENTQLATQIEAIDASIESFEGMRDEALQDGYFD